MTRSTFRETSSARSQMGKRTKPTVGSWAPYSRAKSNGDANTTLGTGPWSSEHRRPGATMGYAGPSALRRSLIWWSHAAAQPALFAFVHDRMPVFHGGLEQAVVELLVR